MSTTIISSAQKREALATVAAVQGDSGDCEKRRLQSTEVAGQFQGADMFSRLQRASGRPGWNIYAIENGGCVASSARQGLLSVCPDNRAACALLRALGG
jgi:hypothetical protein